MVGETRDKFMATETSLDSEYRIVVNAGRILQEEETASKGMETEK